MSLESAVWNAVGILLALTLIAGGLFAAVCTPAPFGLAGLIVGGFAVLCGLRVLFTVAAGSKG